MSNKYEIDDSKNIRTKIIDDAQIVLEEHGKVTRKLLREETGWTKHKVDRFFGSFTKLKEAMGLVDPNEQKLGRAIHKHAMNESAYGDFAKQRSEQANKYNKQTKGRVKRILIGSDMHDLYCDPFYLRCFIETAAFYEPDDIVLAGDIYDMYEFSTYPTHSKSEDVVARFKWGHNLFKALREVAPDANIDFLEGNHEARLWKRILDNKHLYELVIGWQEQSFMDILKLNEFEINYIGNSDMSVEPPKKYIRTRPQPSWQVYYESFLVDHMPSAMRRGIPGVNGHHHSFKCTPQYTEFFGSYNWWQNGCGHVYKAEYCDARYWQMGFMTATVDTMTNDVYFHPHEVGDLCVVHEKIFTRQPEEVIPSCQVKLQGRRRA